MSRSSVRHPLPWMLICLALSPVFGLATPASATVTLGLPDPLPTDQTIVFDQVGLDNPSYLFSDIPDFGDLTVSFGTHFQGQTLGPGANSLSDTQPDNPLQLASDGPTATTLLDFARKGIVLGTEQDGTFYTAPLAIHFDREVSSVFFDLGHLDDGSPTRVEAFDSQGMSLGLFSDLPAGFSTIGIMDSEGHNSIAGVSIFLPEGLMDWEGFGLQNVGFDVNPDDDVNGGGEPMIPEPASWAIWLSLLSAGSVGLLVSRRHRNDG